MGGVFEWFERLGEIPLLPPPGVREYCPLTDERSRPLDASFNDSIRGVACGIEYCDAHGWLSARTVRLLAVDPCHPAFLSAYCHASGETMSFRVDRIISLLDFRSGRMLSSDEHLWLFEPYLATADQASAELIDLVGVQEATRDGVFALLQVAMIDGILGDAARDLVLGYVEDEARISGCRLPPAHRAELWIDNLAPSLHHVVDAVGALLQDRARFARLLPWLLKVTRQQDALADPEMELRTLFADLRRHFRDADAQPAREERTLPDGLRASR
jgi:hypothetical protein